MDCGVPRRRSWRRNLNYFLPLRSNGSPVVRDIGSGHGKPSREPNMLVVPHAVVLLPQDILFCHPLCFCHTHSSWFAGCGWPTQRELMLMAFQCSVCTIWAIAAMIDWMMDAASDEWVTVNAIIYATDYSCIPYWFPLYIGQKLGSSQPWQVVTSWAGWSRSN